MSISAEIRLFVEERAKGYCEYCYAPSVIGISMQVDHIVPQSKGGSDDPENLCWACDHCNRHKLAAQTSLDPQTEEHVLLFNPRQQVWTEHFEWQKDFSEIVGKTPTGRATIERLKMNTMKRQLARPLWVDLQIFPPETEY